MEEIDRHTQLSKILKALANPVRLQILEFVSQSRSCISGDISDEIPLSRTTVIQHLQELEKAGFLLSHTEGKKRFYCLNTDYLKEIDTEFSAFIKNLHIDEYCCNN